MKAIKIVTIFEYKKEWHGTDGWVKFKLYDNGSVGLDWLMYGYKGYMSFPEYEQLLAALMELGGLNSDYWLHALPIKKEGK